MTTMFKLFLLNIVVVCIFIENVGTIANSSIECPMGKRYRSKCNTYFSTAEVDGNQLKTLQDFLDEIADHVTLALDSGVSIPKGTPICIPEFNRKYERNIVFQYRDTADGLQEKGYSMCRVCVRDKTFAHEVTGNQYVTLVVPKVINEASKT